MSQYRVRLLQHEWVNTEVFEPTDTTVFATPPETEEDALTAAQTFLDEHKELEGKEYKIEAELIVEPEPEQETPEEETAEPSEE